jgi:hypothetical protein
MYYYVLLCIIYGRIGKETIVVQRECFGSRGGYSDMDVIREGRSRLLIR